MKIIFENFKNPVNLKHSALRKTEEVASILKGQQEKYQQYNAKEKGSRIAITHSSKFPLSDLSVSNIATWKAKYLKKLWQTKEAC